MPVSKLENIDETYAEKEPNLSRLSDYTMWHLMKEGVRPEQMATPSVRARYEQYLKEQGHVEGST